MFLPANSFVNGIILDPLAACGQRRDTSQSQVQYRPRMWTRERNDGLEIGLGSNQEPGMDLYEYFLRFDGDGFDRVLF